MAKKPIEPRHPELEAAIYADPENAGPYAVLGDWLQSHNDPRGALIGLQIGQKSPERTKAIAALMREHARYLLGPLTAIKDDSGEPVLDWKFGFIYRARLQHKNADHLSKLLRHPSGRFLVDLHLMPLDNEHLDELVSYAPRSLRTLSLDPLYDVDLTRLWPAVSELRQFKLYGTALDFSSISLPALESLHVRSLIRIGPAVASAIATAPWPRLRVLKLGGTELEPFRILARDDMPALIHLTLADQHSLGKSIAPLAESPFAHQLEGLALTSCSITDEGAIELAQNRDRFPRITGLDVTYNPLGDRGLRALRAAFPNVEKHG